MGKRDYTRFSNEKIKTNEIQNGVTEMTPVAEEVPVVDSVEQIPEPEAIEVVTKPEVIGVVVDCVKLNVRKNPIPNGEVIGTLDVDSEVTIDESGSTIEFYKICTAAGIEGFCVKKFIRIK